MKESDKIVRVFVGSEIACLALLAELEKNGIKGIIQDEFRSSIGAGFGGGSPSALDLYISTSDMDNAKSIIEDFLKNNPI